MLKRLVTTSAAKLRKPFPLNTAIPEWRLTMPEETKAPQLQEQINRVKRTLNQNPFIVFVTCILGGISLAAASYFGQPWYLVGLTIFCVCTGFSMFSARNAKEQYKKLIEQLNG